ncbi:MAG: protease HtpX [Candidatus Dojkabacteria bacterium]|nr:MAG: protease HtpX [Candidatus Dojkabacteria bacterium]GIW57075.1 MAG: protease HtpX [Candidatus Dojkabacteria bacterium]
MYSQIDKDNLRTFILLIVFMMFIAASVAVISYSFTRNKWLSIIVGVIAFVTSLINVLRAYFSLDKRILKKTKAVDVTDKPEFKYLNDRVEIIALKAGIPKPRVYILQEKALNAYAIGRDPKHAHIAVTLGLLQELNTEELDGVIAHGMAYIKNYDTRLMSIVDATEGVLAYTMFIFWAALINSREGRHYIIEGGCILLLITIVLIILATTLSTIIKNTILRRRKFLADMTAVEITRHPQGLINALKKLQASTVPVTRAGGNIAHVFIVFPKRRSKLKSKQTSEQASKRISISKRISKQISGFFDKIDELSSTHPPIEERITALNRLTDG